MDKFVRTGIVTLAATVALGTAGFAVASANADSPDTKPVVKREDTSSSWVQSANVDDDPNDDPQDDASGRADSPTHHSTNTTLTDNTRHSKVTKNTTLTKDSAPTNNTVQSKVTKDSAPTKNTHQTVNSTPTDNSGRR